MVDDGVCCGGWGPDGEVHGGSVMTKQMARANGRRWPRGVVDA
jgi:hypothetical protein